MSPFLFYKRGKIENNLNKHPPNSITDDSCHKHQLHKLGNQFTNKKHLWIPNIYRHSNCTNRMNNHL